MEKLILRRTVKGKIEIARHLVVGSFFFAIFLYFVYLSLNVAKVGIGLVIDLFVSAFCLLCAVASFLDCIKNFFGWVGVADDSICIEIPFVKKKILYKDISKVYLKCSITIGKGGGEHVSWSVNAYARRLKASGEMEEKEEDISIIFYFPDNGVHAIRQMLEANPSIELAQDPETRERPFDAGGLAEKW